MKTTAIEGANGHLARTAVTRPRGAGPAVGAGARKRIRRLPRLLFLGAATGLAVVLAACSSPAAEVTPGATSSEPIKVVVNYEPTASAVSLKLAYDEGIFKKNGLDVELFEGGPGSSAMSLLINGQINVVPTFVQVGILAAAEGLPIVLASNQATDVEGQPSFATVSGPGTGISSFRDLSGKTVGIHSNACCWEQLTRDAVANEGGDPDSVSFLQVPFPNQAQALRDGQVDAITSIQPFIALALDAGGTLLGQTTLVALGTDESVGGAFFMAKDFVESHPGVVEAWQASIDEAYVIFEADPERERALIVQETGIDAALVEQMPLPRSTTTLSKDLYEETIAYLVRYGALDESAAPPADDFLAPGVIG